MNSILKENEERHLILLFLAMCNVMCNVYITNLNYLQKFVKSNQIVYSMITNWFITLSTFRRKKGFSNLENYSGREFEPGVSLC